MTPPASVAKSLSSCNRLVLAYRLMLTVQLADHVADSFATDTAKWPELKDVPESLDTRIVSVSRGSEGDS